jgi:CHAT domain-containing protein
VDQFSVGVNNPSIGHEPGSGRGKRKGIDVRGIFRNVELKGGQASALSQEEEVADVEFIRAQDGLPETASELRALARALKGDDQFIWLRYQATETQVKRLDLSRFRTIAFATHGVMAGQIRVAREAGLILTPPR